MKKDDQEPLKYDRDSKSLPTNITTKEIFFKYMREIIVGIIALALILVICITHQTMDKTILGALGSGVIGSVGYILPKLKE